MVGQEAEKWEDTLLALPRPPCFVTPESLAHEMVSPTFRAALSDPSIGVPSR